MCERACSRLDRRGVTETPRRLHREQARFHDRAAYYFNGGVRGGIMRLLPVASNADAKRSNAESS